MRGKPSFIKRCFLRKSLGIPKNLPEYVLIVFLKNKTKKPKTSPSHMEDDDLVEMYRAESLKSINNEAEVRLNSTIPMKERIRLRSLSLIQLILENKNHEDLIPALLERLGPVRAALDGHGGGIIIKNSEIVNDNLLNLILTLNGSCIACGAAPGTLIGIKEDLEKDSEIMSVFFDTELLETFDELSKEFLVTQTNILFKSN